MIEISSAAPKFIYVLKMKTRTSDELINGAPRNGRFSAFTGAY
jgi:hypothetical protein